MSVDRASQRANYFHTLVKDRDGDEYRLQHNIASGVGVGYFLDSLYLLGEGLGHWDRHTIVIVDMLLYNIKELEYE